MIDSFVLLANVVLVLAMCGGVWLRQLIYYPLLSFVGEDRVPSYQRENRRRVQLTLQPAQVITVILAVMLVFWHSASIPAALPVAGVACEVLVVAATGYEVPRQRRLETGFSSEVLSQLLAGNWVRVAALSLHAALVVWMLTLVMAP